MSEKPSQISLFVDKKSISIMWICAKHFESILKLPEEIVIFTGLLNKLSQEIATDKSSPFDAFLTLTAEEESQLDFALHMTMTDASMAKEYGLIADKYIGKIRLSSLADQVPLMADILRMLYVANQIAYFDQRISIIEERLGIK